MIQAYTVPQVMAKLQLSRETVYGLIRTGRLQSVKIGKSRRITDDHLARFIASLEGEGEGKAA